MGIWDNDTVILVDAGYPGQLPTIGEAIDKTGVSFDQVNKIIITHHDIDHIGSLPGILNASPQKIEVLAHQEEKPHIQGEKPMLKMGSEDMSKFRSQLGSLPEEQRKAIMSVFENPPQAKVDQTLNDGEELPYCGGITIIHSPGHTNGHISLYLKQNKTLVAGDAMRIENDQLLGPMPEATFDLDLAKKSLHKLTQYDIENVVCYHGGLYKGNANQRIAELAN